MSFLVSRSSGFHGGSSSYGVVEELGGSGDRLHDGDIRRTRSSGYKNGEREPVTASGTETGTRRGNGKRRERETQARRRRERERHTGTTRPREEQHREGNNRSRSSGRRWRQGRGGGWPGRARQERVEPEVDEELGGGAGAVEGAEAAQPRQRHGDDGWDCRPGASSRTCGRARR